MWPHLVIPTPGITERWRFSALWVKVLAEGGLEPLTIGSYHWELSCHFTLITSMEQKYCGKEMTLEIYVTVHDGPCHLSSWVWDCWSLFLSAFFRIFLNYWWMHLFPKAYDCYDKRVTCQKERQKNLTDQFKMLLDELEKYAAKVWQYDKFLFSFHHRGKQRDLSPGTPWWCLQNLFYEGGGEIAKKSLTRLSNDVTSCHAAVAMAMT